MTLIRLVARPMLASMFVAAGVNALRNTEAVTQRAKPVTDRFSRTAVKVAPTAPIPDDPKTLVRMHAGVQIAAGLAFATGRAPRLSATVLAASMLPTVSAGHPFWEESDPELRANERSHFFKNVSMLGGLFLAAVDTEGKPGVAWRAKHSIGSARREAKHLRKQTRAQARLAAKSVRG